MKRRVEPKGRPILFRPKELLLYVVLAVFLAISPLITEHWLLVRGIAVILCLAVCGRVVHVVAEKTGRSERPPAEPIPIFKQDGISVIIAGMAYAALGERGKLAEAHAHLDRFDPKMAFKLAKDAGLEVG